jgi:TolB-like protein/Tfp pilus assembly protein PilF
MSFSPINLWQDLRRRNVVKVAAIYAASAWLVVQVADLLIDRIPAISEPDQLMTWLIAAVIAGFPVAAILAWLFEIGPEGVVRTRPGSATGIGAIVVSLGLLVAGTAGLSALLRGDGRVAAGIEAGIAPNRIAVMPFADLSPGGGALNLGAGIAETLRTQLQQIGDLRVISRGSSEAAQRNGLGLADIRSELRVPRLLEGSVQRAGGRLRVTAQLVDTQSAEAIWTNVFDRATDDIFAIQDEIVLAVADAMQAIISAELGARVTRHPTEDLDAYELYLLAKESAWTADIRSGYAEAIDLYTRALDLDPNMAAAWAGLASATFWHGMQGYVPYPEALEDSWEYSARALEIDPENGDTHAHRIILYSQRQQPDLADEAFELAVRYNPSSPAPYLNYGIVQLGMQQYTRAIEVLRHGLDLQPYKPEPLLRANLASAYAALGDYERGMRLHGANYVDSVGKPTEGQYLYWMARPAKANQRFDEAAAFYAIGRRDGFADSRAYADSALVSMQMRRFADAGQLLDEAERLVEQEQAGRTGINPGRAYVEFTRVQLDLATGDVAAALAWARDLDATISSAPDHYYWSWRFYDVVYVFAALDHLEEGVRTSAWLVHEGSDAENYLIAAATHLQLAKQERARNETKRADELDADAADYVARARTELDSLIEAAPEAQQTFLWASAYHATAGHGEEALDMLERAYEAHYRDLFYLHFMPMFDSIRTEPRYLEIARKISDDLAAMSARVDEAAASGDWERLVARFLDAGLAANLVY